MDQKLKACDCTICAKGTSSRSFLAAGGRRTAMMASQALDDASQWLMGQMPQMPQMRAVIPGISQNGRRSAMPRKPSIPRCWNESSALSAHAMLMRKGKRLMRCNESLQQSCTIQSYGNSILATPVPCLPPFINHRPHAEFHHALPPANQA